MVCCARENVASGAVLMQLLRWSEVEEAGLLVRELAGKRAKESSKRRGACWDAERGRRLKNGRSSGSEQIK
jgi:hypothetical protein